MTNRPDPVAQADDAARALARDLIAAARFATLAVTDPADGFPGISRIAFGPAAEGGFVTLISALAPHYEALRRNPGSRKAIATFHWRNSAPFAWHSQQLLDLGLMEPGQWF